MEGRLLSEVLSLPVRMHGIVLGRPVGAFVHQSSNLLVGFEILCGDGARRFLPFGVARVLADEIALDSALALIDERDVDYYRRRARRVPEAGYDQPWLDADGCLHDALSAA
jgi:hypothetical protein